MSSTEFTWSISFELLPEVAPGFETDLTFDAPEISNLPSHGWFSAINLVDLLSCIMLAIM